MSRRTNPCRGPSAGSATTGAALAGPLPLFLLFLLFVLLTCTPRPGSAQAAAPSYEEALRQVQQYRGKLRPFRPAIRWIAGGKGLWWSEKREGKTLYILIDAKSGQRKEGTDAQSLGIPQGPSVLRVRARRSRSGPSREHCGVRFENHTKNEVGIFWIDSRGGLHDYGKLAPGGARRISSYVGHVFVLRVKNAKVSAYFIAEAGEGIARMDARAQSVILTAERRRLRKKKARKLGPRIRDGNLHLLGKGGKDLILGRGDEENGPLVGPLHVSPDGSHALCFQVSVVETRKIPLVESSPKGGVQPILHLVPYRKPGDPIPQKRPRLFDLQGCREVPVAAGPFADSYSVRFQKWSADSKRAWFLYNRRGHQELSLIAIEAKTGRHRYIVRERSKTFIDYSQKTYYRFLPGDEQLLWASERDGWNHLYRIDARSGKVLAKVTKGPWVLRRVLHVDPDRREILFLALGMREGEDPYHAQLARVNFDGEQLLRLTEGDGNHSVRFNEDHSLFVDRWSRVDHVAVTELRRTKDGKKIAELGRDDATALLAAGYRMPERFVAKGRDGKTRIYGFLIRPSHFDKSKRYPVLEAIYAGPHSFHVPKDFGTQAGLRRMAEFGFIVVKIDGMGTNWRRKSFHDVCWQNLKDAGLPDRILWMRAAAKKHSELDLTRVGIYGGSAGGQSAMAALLWHGDFYKAAAADCGCHDNRMDKIWWNEAWMGKLGPHYAANSNAVHAARLSGKLFLTVGELDHNVDPASTLQVVNALIAAKKDFEFYLIPGKGHGAGGEPFFAKKRALFFRRALGSPEEPD